MSAPAFEVRYLLSTSTAPPVHSAGAEAVIEVSAEGAGFQPVNVPTGLDATAVSATEVAVTWTTPAMAGRQVEVDRSRWDGSEWEAWLPVGEADSEDQELADPNLEAETLYRYRARARDAATGTTSDWTDPVEVTTLEAESEPPNAPTATAVATAHTHVLLTATFASTGPQTASVTFYRSASPGVTTSDTEVGSVASSGGRLMDSGLSAGTTYYYLPVATNAAGDTEGSEVSATTYTAAWVASINSGEFHEVEQAVPSDQDLTGWTYRLGRLATSLSDYDADATFVTRVLDGEDTEVAGDTLNDVPFGQDGAEYSVNVTDAPGGQTYTLRVEYTQAGD